MKFLLTIFYFFILFSCQSQGNGKGNGKKKIVVDTTTVGDVTVVTTTTTETEVFVDSSQVEPVDTTGRKMISFSFPLTAPATVSAGLYNGDVLIRTIFNNRQYKAGIFSESFEALDDEMMPIDNVKGLTVKVVSNNIKYEWEGVIGNTSADKTGSHKYRSYNSFYAVSIGDNYGYYSTGYNESYPAQNFFSLKDIQHRTAIFASEKPGTAQSTSCVASDSNYIYWAGGDPYSKSVSKETVNFVFATSKADQSEVIFPKGIAYKAAHGRTYKSVIALTKEEGSEPAGIASQKRGVYLFISYPKKNKVVVYTKAGDSVNVFYMKSPTALAVDGEDNLFVSEDGSISKYSVGENGSLINILSIPGRSLALAASDSLLLSADSATSVINAYDLKGSLLWSLGKQGGYYSTSTVEDDRFYLHDKRAGDYGVSLSFQSDGSFWLVDGGNNRLLHFSKQRTLIEQVMFQPHSYSVFVDKNSPERIFCDYLEFRRDYAKPLAPDNGSWKLVRNWGAVVPESDDDKYGRLRNVATLKNGKTYALNSVAVYELVPNGVLRKVTTLSKKYDLYEDGSLRTSTASKPGDRYTFYQLDLTGFSGDNPVWGKEYIAAASPAITINDPQARDLKSRGEKTGSGIFIAYDGSSFNPATGAGGGWHLAGIDSTGRWLWKTAHATRRNFKGDFPTDGSFDIGNSVVRTGDVRHFAIDRYELYGQHGEFWKGSQINKWNLFYDNGLMLGQFGVTGPECNGEEASAELAGNVFTGNVVRVGDVYYLYHNDESHHGGIHSWKITNAESVFTQTVTPAIVFSKPDSTINYLLAGLPTGDTLMNGDYGWTVSPDNNKNYLSAVIGTYTHDRFVTPDIYTRYSPTLASAYKSAFVSRQFEADSNFIISGEILFEAGTNQDIKNTGPDGNGGQFFELLDSTGNVIFRLFRQLNYSTRWEKIIANGVTIEEGQQDVFEPHTKEFQKFVVTPGTVEYAGIKKAIKVPGKPAALRVYYWYNTRPEGRAMSIKNVTIQ